MNNELALGTHGLDLGDVAAIRYMIGDGLFNQFFQFQKGEFTISQQCYKPVNPASKVGNLLFPFYDRPMKDNIGYFLDSQARIKMGAFFNHPRYISKHPKGTERLQNVIQIDDYHITFRPGAPRNILSREEVECALMVAYNASRTLADEEEIRFYAKNQDNMHPHLRKSFGLLVEEAKDLADHNLCETDWRDTKVDREKMAHGYHVILNFQKLRTSLEKTRDAYFNGTMNTNVIKRAEELQGSAFRNKLDEMWKLLTL